MQFIVLVITFVKI